MPFGPHCCSICEVKKQKALILFPYRPNFFYLITDFTHINRVIVSTAFCVSVGVSWILPRLTWKRKEIKSFERYKEEQNKTGLTEIKFDLNNSFFTNEMKTNTLLLLVL